MPGSPTGTDHQRVSARISGRVQGVGFRYFTAARARSLSLTGWVRNEYDGSVAVVVEGAPDRLREFLDHLKAGPPTSRVDHLDANWHPATGEFASFTVR